jgi:hypothetical protein
MTGRGLGGGQPAPRAGHRSARRSDGGPNHGTRRAEGRIAKTDAFVFSLDEGADVGADEGTPVTEAYQAGASSRFTGTIHKVTLEVK